LSDQARVEVAEAVREEIGELFRLRQPHGGLAVIVVSWVAVVAGLYAAFQVVTTGNVALNFILFGPVSLRGLGIVPLVYVTRFKIIF